MRYSVSGSLRSFFSKTLQKLQFSKNLPSLAKRQENNSTQHQGWVMSSNEFIRITEEKSSSIASLISSGHKIKVSTNRHALEKIIDIILLCGRQNIPLRGHVEERNNFIAILHEKAKYIL